MIRTTRLVKVWVHTEQRICDKMKGLRSLFLDFLLGEWYTPFIARENIMTKFEKSEFSYDGMYLKYKGQFVARFKYAHAKRRKPSFLKFLIANFTVEEYFAERDAGKAPLIILMDKGYREWISQ